MEINSNTKIEIKKLDLTSKKNLYELWKKTPELSMNVFCKQQGIASSTFHYWCKKFDNNKVKNIKPQSNWMSVNMQQTKQLEPSKIVPLELLFPNNMKATINISIKEVINLIKEICYATTIVQ